MPVSLSDREFEILVWENQDLIFKICSVYTHSKADQDDLFQEITINLWKGIGSFKGHSKLSTWIYRVGLNTAINRARKQKKNPIVYREAVPESEYSESDEAHKELLVSTLYRGIDQLKPVEKAIVLLYLEEKSYEEIAEIMGMSKSNVSVKLVRLKRKLEKIMKPMMEMKV